MGSLILRVLLDRLPVTTFVGRDEVHLQEIEEVLLLAEGKLLAVGRGGLGTSHAATTAHLLPAGEHTWHKAGEGAAVGSNGATGPHEVQAAPVELGRDEHVQVGTGGEPHAEVLGIRVRIPGNDAGDARLDELAYICQELHHPLPILRQGHELDVAYDRLEAPDGACHLDAGHGLAHVGDDVLGNALGLVQIDLSDSHVVLLSDTGRRCDRTLGRRSAADTRSQRVASRPGSTRSCACRTQADDPGALLWREAQMHYHGAQ